MSGSKYRIFADFCGHILKIVENYEKGVRGWPLVGFTWEVPGS